VSDQDATESFGGRLRALRERAGLSQSALARKAGLDPSFINRLESGQRGADRKVAEDVIQALELPPADADRLLAAGGHLPAVFARVGLQDPTLQLVARTLSDAELSAAAREGFRTVVAAAHDPLVQLVAGILADERLGREERAAFRQVVELIGRRWRSERRNS
jgi:transcriptional regulator with XRE-family HTH domain